MTPVPDHFQRFATHPETRRFGKFAIVGVLNTTIDLGVFLALSKLLGVHYLWANFFAYIVATVNSYYINRRWTFKSTAANWRRELVQYFLVIGIGFMINESLLYVLVDHVHLPSVLAKLLVIGVVVVWNYGANRLWTFRKSLPV